MNDKRFFNNKKSAFTLIELLIVIAIMKSMIVQKMGNNMVTEQKLSLAQKRMVSRSPWIVYLI